MLYDNNPPKFMRMVSKYDAGLVYRYRYSGSGVYYLTSNHPLSRRYLERYLADINQSIYGSTLVGVLMAEDEL